MSASTSTRAAGQPTEPSSGQPTFEELGIHRRLVNHLAGGGITVPRPIQTATIRAALEGRDVCGRAPTGSGKTLAFVLPLAHMESGDGRPVAMVLAPTRELALQIEEVLKPLALKQKLFTRTLIGGTSINKDLSALRRGVDIVVGCPGRMVDLVNRGALDLSKVDVAVLDEADRMADMGFMPDVTRLLDATRCKQGQLLLFSATLDATTDKLQRRYQTDPERVDVGVAKQADGDVSHTWHVVPRQQRRQNAERLLAEHKSAIVFTRTKRGADRLARQLSKAGQQSAAIHGDRSQRQRQRALAQFVEGSVGVLVATDIAARGIHVDDVDVVMHYDLPATAEDYTHRSGRTGRAGADGTVLALVCDDAEADASTLARDLRMDPSWVGRSAAGASNRSANADGERTGSNNSAGTRDPKAAQARNRSGGGGGGGGKGGANRSGGSRSGGNRSGNGGGRPGGNRSTRRNGQGRQSSSR